MAAPSKVKTWTHTDINVPIGSGPPNQLVSGCALSAWAADIRQFVWELKNFLTTAPAAWTVVSSCGESGGTGSFTAGAADYWTTAANVWAPYLGEYSWIVLKSTNISATGQGFQICIYFDGSGCNPYEIRVLVSPSAGFTGGTTSAHPTATDGVQIWDGAFTGGSTYTRGASCFKSSDGECVRIFTSYNSDVNTIRMWMFDRATAVHSEWSIPYVAYVAQIPTYTYMHDNVAARVQWSAFNATAINLCTEGQGGGALGRWTDRCDIANYWGEYICTRISVVVGNNIANSSKAAFLGWVQDLWFTSDNLNDFDFFPVGGTKEYVVFGDFVQPNEDGETPVIH